MGRAADGRLGMLKCIKPFMVDGATPVRCGGCTECRVFNKLQAVLRAQLELGASEARGVQTSVWTLTYAPEFLPPNGDVSREDSTGFRKRLQVEMQRKFSIRVRVWGPAEYGDQSMRPHYHFILYGVDVFNSAHCAVVRAAWSRDGVSMGMCHADYAGRDGVMEYLAGYCVKKWNRPCDQLKGHVPEFVVWPQRPPLGGALADALVASLSDAVGQAQVAALGQDVPGAIRYGPRLVALPRTLRRRARALLGLDTPEAKAARAAAQSIRNRVARAWFEGGDWLDPQAHVDLAGIDQAQSRRKVFSSSKRKRSL